MLTPEFLHRLLRYEPDSGRLFWRPRPASLFSDGKHSAVHNAAKWNARWAGHEALSAFDGRYLTGRIFGQNYQAHRVIWALIHGRWPTHEIDHQNHVRTLNTPDNLRDVTSSENSKNQPLRKSSRSGHTGVHWHNRSRRWVAKIHVKGRTIHLGNFAQISDAVAARKDAERQHGFHSNHGRAA